MKPCSTRRFGFILKAEASVGGGSLGATGVGQFLTLSLMKVRSSASTADGWKFNV